MITYDENEGSCIICRAYITSNTPEVVGSWLDAFGQNYRRDPKPHVHTPARLT